VTPCSTVSGKAPKSVCWRPGHLCFDGNGTKRFDVLGRYEYALSVAVQIGPLQVVADTIQYLDTRATPRRELGLSSKLGSSVSYTKTLIRN
jgi:hypothetical protein